MFFTGESRRKLVIFSLALAQGLRVGDKVHQGFCALAMLLYIECFITLKYEIILCLKGLQGSCAANC